MILSLNRRIKSDILNVLPLSWLDILAGNIFLLLNFPVFHHVNRWSSGSAASQRRPSVASSRWSTPARIYTVRVQGMLNVALSRGFASRSRGGFSGAQSVRRRKDVRGGGEEPPGTFTGPDCTVITVTLFSPTSFLRKDNDVFVNVKINQLETHKKMQTAFNHMRLTGHLHIN